MSRTVRETWKALLPLLACLLALPAAATVKRVRTDNDLTIIAKPNTWNRIIAVSVVIDAGSRSDPAKRRGLANLTANLLLGGTETRSALDIAETADESGIRLGSVTTEDYTEVYVTSIDSRIDTALDLLTDVLTSPVFPEERLVAEKRQASEQLEKLLDSAFDRTYMRVNEILFGKHPYAFPAFGTKDGIGTVSRADVAAFYSEHYVTGGTVIAAVGNFDADDIVERIARRFSGYRQGKPESPAPVRTPKRKPRRADFFKDTSRGHVQIGFLAPSVFDDEFATVKVLDAIIGSGLSSRLFLALGNEGAGIADVAGSFYPTRRDLGRYVVYVSTNEFDQSIGTVEETITNLKTETVTPEELSRAKHRVLGDLTLGRQTNHEQARMLGWAELLGLGTDFVEAHREAVERVEPEEVREAAQEFLVDPVTVILRPGRGSKRGI